MLPQDRMCWLSMHRSIWQCWVFDIFCRDVVFETITAGQIFLNIFGEPPVCFTVCSPVLFLAATSVHPDHVWLTCCWTVVWWAVVLLCCSLLFSVVLCYTGQPLRRQTVASPVSFFKRAWTAHLHSSVCLEIFACERLCWCNSTALFPVAVFCLSKVFDFLTLTVIHNTSVPLAEVLTVNV